MIDVNRIEEAICTQLEEAGTDVLVTWEAYPEGTTIDPVTQSEVLPEGGAVIPMQMTVRALLHFPQPVGNTAVRQFNEVEVGDCIADFHQDVELDGKAKLQFVFLDECGEPIDGQKWVVKPIGEKLAQSWDAVVGGQRLMRTVLLRKAT